MTKSNISNKLPNFIYAGIDEDVNGMPFTYWSEDETENSEEYYSAEIYDVLYDLSGSEIDMLNDNLDRAMGFIKQYKLEIEELEKIIKNHEEKSSALCSLEYSRGMLEGWRLHENDNEEEFQRIRNLHASDGLKLLKSIRD